MMTTTHKQELSIEHAHEDRKTLVGFWVYVMTDCVLFASLFATYAVLQSNTNGGPAGRELFSLDNVLAETLLLLSSSFAAGMAVLAARSRQKKAALGWLLITGILGILFLALELSEFRALVLEGNNWRRSGFLSAFFTLVGTHGLHITAGLVWLIVLLQRVASTGLSRITIRRLTLFSIFWHFLDLVWIFIFTIVYLSGAIQ